MNGLHLASLMGRSQDNPSVNIGNVYLHSKLENLGTSKMLLTTVTSSTFNITGNKQMILMEPYMPGLCKVLYVWDFHLWSIG